MRDDLIAGTLIQKLSAAGFRVPLDFRVVGIDDVATPLCCRFP